MNPLLFADWRRINRSFTKLMWMLAAILACVVLVVANSAGAHHHSPAPTRGNRTAAGASR